MRATRCASDAEERLVPRSQPLLAPQVDGNIVGVVHEALLDGKQIEAKYRSRQKKKVLEMKMHPLGLVHRESVAYLVATAFDYPDPRLYPLHRFVDAKLLDAKAKIPSAFHLDRFIETGELSYRVSEGDIDLELLFEESAGRSLEETPLSHKQELKPQGDKILVKVRIPDTQVLRSWILGFGAKFEVLKPRALRDAIATAHREALARYADN